MDRPYQLASVRVTHACRKLTKVRFSGENLSVTDDVAKPLAKLLQK
jgi:hypothetical protein